MLLLFSPDVIGEMFHRSQDRPRFSGISKIIGMRVLMYGLEETAEVLQRGGAPVINRTAKLIAEAVVCVF